MLEYVQLTEYWTCPSGMLLPCQNDPGATAQVNPAIDLLRNLDSKHPDVLSAHGVEPADYHSKRRF